MRLIGAPLLSAASGGACGAAARRQRAARAALHPRKIADFGGEAAPRWWVHRARRHEGRGRSWQNVPDRPRTLGQRRGASGVPTLHALADAAFDAAFGFVGEGLLPDGPRVPTPLEQHGRPCFVCRFVESDVQRA